MLCCVSAYEPFWWMNVCLVFVWCKVTIIWAPQSGASPTFASRCGLQLARLWEHRELPQQGPRRTPAASDFFVYYIWKQQPFCGPLSTTTRVRRYEKEHSPTHHPDHHPIFISFFHLPRSIASSLFKLHAWQSFPCPLWSTSWSGALHLIFDTFLHPISDFFSQHMPIPSQPVLL